MITEYIPGQAAPFLWVLSFRSIFSAIVAGALLLGILIVGVDLGGVVLEDAQVLPVSCRHLWPGFSWSALVLQGNLASRPSAGSIEVDL